MFVHEIGFAPPTRAWGNSAPRIHSRDAFVLAVGILAKRQARRFHGLHYSNSRALVLVARHPEAVYASAEMNTFWASVRSVVSPPESLRVLWLVDPRRCWW